MSKMYFKSSKGFWSGKGFYVALALCLVAVGAASYIAIRSITDIPESLDLGSVPEQTVSSKETAQAGQTVSGVTGSKPDKPSSSSSKVQSAASKPKNTVASFFVMPVTGDIIKPFNDTQLQYSETYRDWRLHAGIDIEAKKNDPVKAAGDGKVSEVTTDTLWGTTVVIDHGNGIKSHYAGLAKSPPVKAGDVVEVNKVIGYIDVVPCEMSDPSHLHFVITQNGKAVSPLKVMNLLD